jgi:hypothetical protein
MVDFKQTKWNEKKKLKFHFNKKKKKTISIWKHNILDDINWLLWFIIFVMTFYLSRRNVVL